MTNHTDTEDMAQDALAEYDDMIAYRDTLLMQKAEQIAAVIPAEVQADIEAIEAETAPKLAEAERRIAAFKALAENAALEIGKTMRSDHFIAVYSKPGKTVKAEDVLRVADSWRKVNPEFAAELTSIITITKPRVSVQVRRDA